PDRRSVDDAQRRADRHEPRELADLVVLDPDAAVRRASGDQARLVRAVDADDATARPVGEVRIRARAERPRSVDAASADALQALADPELPAWRRRVRLADPHARAPDRLVA